MITESPTARSAGIHAASLFELLSCRNNLSIHLPFSPDLRRSILDVSRAGSVSEICRLNFVLGELFADAALSVMAKAHLSPPDIIAIGSHGQTIHHLPNDRPASTFQIGELSVI